MKYTYEFLRKCHGLRFKAVKTNKNIEGFISVERDEIILCFGNEVLGNADYFHRSSFAVIASGRGFDEAGISEFEIIPRDPETYKDWQVGDVYVNNDINERCVVIFRCGELVFYKQESDGRCSSAYTCDELFENGFCLVLTDVEKQILEERKKEVWKPQDGDICCAGKWVFIKEGGKDSNDAYARFNLASGSCSLYTKVPRCDSVDKLHPATDFEKNLLFYALAKKGKRWNAEEKRFEDIPASHEFKKFDQVLVRNGIYNNWTPNVFLRKEDGFCRTVDNKCWTECIPLDEDTESLIGTSNNYAEEK